MFINMLITVNKICFKIGEAGLINRITIDEEYILLQTEYPFTLIYYLKKMGIEGEYFDCIDYRVVRVKTAPDINKN